MIGWLTGTLLATNVLILLVFAIRAPVRRYFGAPVAYALWLLPASRVALPSFTTIVERPATMASAGPGSMGLPSAAPLPEPSLLDQIGGWPAILVALWLAGAGVMLVRGFQVYRAQRRAILGAAVHLAELDGIRIVRSETVSGPLAFGLFDRVIALPLDFDARFSMRERRFALDHELAHHRSGDLVANTIAFVLLCLQWFNPLAWAAHAAFRFDQEAACDARVLDKADARERGFYGTAIGKAASGRTLLFAGALDRPSTLSRRLTIMINSTNSRARKLGFLLLGGGLLLALPMTATSAVHYVDIATPSAVSAARSPAPFKPVLTTTQPIPAIPAIASAPALPAVKLAALAPISDVRVGAHDISFIGNDTVRINGVTKRWEELTPAERARIRDETDKARVQINKEVARLPEQLANMRRELARFQNGDFRREMAEARAGIAQSMAEIDGQARILRATGQDPEKIKADLRRSLSEIAPAQVEETIRNAVVGLDPDKLQANILEAQRSLDEIETKLNKLDGR